MGKKSSPPPAPDYTAAAEKTAQSSQEAQTRADWANRPTQNTPWGQSSWQASAGVDPATGQPITSWEQNITLSPQQQQALDQQMQMQAGRSDLAQNMMGRVGASTAQPFDWAGMPQAGQAPVGGQWAGMPPGMSQWRGEVYSPRMEGAGQGIQSSVAGAGQGIQGQVGGTGLDSRMRLENAMMERMRPEHERQTAGLEGKLANMGLTRGSEAWNRESQRMGDQQSRERFNALDRGLQEQQGQFGMNLGAGQFANQAQAQGFGQNMANAQFGNQAQQQGFGQMMGQNQQNFQQGMANQQLLGQQLGQNFQQGLQGQQLLGQQLGQNFQQGMAGADYQNRLRQQGIAEQMMQRNMPLNEMNALLTGQQVNMPNMPGFQGSQSAGGANYLGAANMQYNAGLNAYNANQAQSQGLMSGLGSLGSLGMMAYGMSDIRLKSNIERVGTHPVGVGIYEYDIFGRRERGVIAQELMQVRPDLVAVHDSGYLMVNYGGLQ